MGIAHDEGADACGVGEGEGEACPAAHRLGDEGDGAGGVVDVDEGGEVVGEGSRAGFGARLLGWGEPAVGEGKAAVTGFDEGGDLLPPGEVIAAEAMGEDDERGFGRAVGFVPESCGGAIELCHGGRSYTGGALG